MSDILIIVHDEPIKITIAAPKPPSTFLGLEDVDETTFVGKGGDMVRVKVDESGLEFGVGAYTLLPATASVLGGVKQGSGVSIDVNGVLSAAGTYTLPVATGSVLGGVKDGDRITIAADGTISADIQTTDISGKVDKVTGSSLVADTEIAKIHAAGSDNQDLSGKQDVLESGVNIKTVGGSSLLGSGDIEVSSGIWKALIGTYASTSTFTFTGTIKDVNLIQFSLFTCTSSDGNTRRIGYVKSSVNNAGTITATVVIDSNLAAGDIGFKVAYNRKVDDYIHLISIPGEVIADASYSQGTWRQNLKSDCYLLPVDFSVLTAATDAGAALTVNVYKNTTALFNTAPDFDTAATLVEQRPTTNTLSAGENISLRIMSSEGATKAADFQAKLYIIPTLIYTAF
jgi:hypothetical protein